MLQQERFGTTENEFSEITVTLRGVIAEFRVEKFDNLEVCTAVIIDIDEFEAANPQPSAVDYR